MLTNKSSQYVAELRFEPWLVNKAHVFSVAAFGSPFR